MQGADKFYCDGKTYTANTHDLVFINPGEVHTGSTVSDEPLHYYSINPTKHELEQIAMTLQRSLPGDFYFRKTLSDRAESLKKILHFFNAFHPKAADTIHYEEFFFDFMNDLFDEGCCTKEAILKEDKKDPRIRQIVDFIQSKFKEPLSLQQMALHVNVSPFHLIRLFKKATSLSPYEYLIIKRIEYAKQLLRQGIDVQEAALESGFYDASHFNRLFRKIAGASPKIFHSSKSQYCTIYSAW